MNISKVADNKLVVTGDVSTIQDYQAIKTDIESMIAEGVNNVYITFQDTASLTSAVIGYMIKSITINDISISLEIGSSQLYELLGQLNLASTFNIRKL